MNTHPLANASAVAGGDILKYEMEFHKVDFTAAWLRLNDFHSKVLRKGPKATNVVKPARTERVRLSPEKIDERDGYARRLETDRWIAEEICRKRYEYNGEKWNPDTIQGLAMEGPLGWAMLSPSCILQVQNIENGLAKSFGGTVTSFLCGVVTEYIVHTTSTSLKVKPTRLRWWIWGSKRTIHTLGWWLLRVQRHFIQNGLNNLKAKG